MDKKSILEIRKQLNVTNINLVSLTTAFLHGADKEITKKTTVSGMSLSDDMLFRVIEILKKTLNGTIEKNLYESPVNTESDIYDSLHVMASQKVTDKDIDNLFEKISQNYDVAENAYIQVAKITYDVPMRATDGAVLEDSDSVFEFIICSVCPIEFEKAALTIAGDKFVEAERRPIVKMPEFGFMYPAFINREPVVDKMVLYVKKPQDMPNMLIMALTDRDVPASNEIQKRSFFNVLTNLSNQEIPFESMQNLQSVVNAEIENKHSSNEDTRIGKDEMKGLLQQADFDVTDFDKIFEAESECKTFALENLIDAKKFNINSYDVKININPEKSDVLISREKYKGKNCFIIPIEGQIEVNGAIVGA